MTPDKVAELTTQIILAAMQNDKFDAGNALFVASYYETIASEIIETAQGMGEKD